MGKKTSLIFAVLFCILIASVAVVQLLYEIRKGERIQALDLIADTFVTPAQRTAALKKEFSKLLDSCTIFRKSGITSVNTDQMAGRAEDILAGSETVRRLFVEINRHVADSAQGTTRDFDTLVVKAQLLRDAVDEERSNAVGQASENLAAVVADMQKKYTGAPTVSAFLTGTVHAFFRTTFFNTHYIREYEKGIEKRSIIAQTLRPVMQRIRYALLRDAGDKAITGKEKWLFYRPDVEYVYRPSVFDRRSGLTDYNDKAFTDDPLAVIVDFKEQLSKRGIDLLVVIIPGKPSIYPDLLARCDPPAINCRISPSRAFIDTLESHDVAAVDLFMPFYKERRRDSSCKDSFYLTQDTHWKSRGLRLAACNVAERVKKYSWFSDEHVTATFSLDSVVVQREGDIGNMTDLINNPFEKLRVSFPLEKTVCYQVLQTATDEAGNIIRKDRFRDDFQNARILILGDSFSRIYQTDAPGGAGWIAHLAYDLSEPVASLVNDGGASTLVREKLARKSAILKGKRLVVWEFVERDIRYGAFGWKRVKLP